MVPYAGKDANEVPLGKLAAQRTRPEIAYDYFHLGMDTLAIAKIMQQPESDVLRWINQERSRCLGLANPYEVRT